MDENFIISVVEGLILASPEPLPGKKISDLLDKMTPSKVSKAVAELNSRYVETGSSFRIRELAGGYQFYILPEFTGYVSEMFSRTRKMRLTKAALETLAIVAYKQPVTKTEVELIRGVASDGVLHNLLEKKMLTIKGRAETVGKPLQYGTTDEFLKFFGLNGLADMPKMSEIEALLATVESKNQTELSLDEELLQESKLNVADESYEPEIENSNDNNVTFENKTDDTNKVTTESLEEEFQTETTSQDSIIVDLDQT